MTEAVTIQNRLLSGPVCALLVTLSGRVLSALTQPQNTTRAHDSTVQDVERNVPMTRAWR
jgi:hypothetical protein